MLSTSHAFASFSVGDLEQAREFYGTTLGLNVKDEEKGMGLMLNLAGDTKVFVYPKADHQPASFTVLNFPVDDIDQAVADLTSKGITFEQYKTEMFETDDDGIARGKADGMGPDIAWFTDPFGNVISVLEN